MKVPLCHITLHKLPEGVQLTLSELREMACQQQAQIESQHQLLAAKEQRLRYLKEQEARQQRVHAESERLRRLRDRVDAQELKLRKLRALRGQVDQQKQNNISLTSDLDSIRALFNEKEKELSLAVAKVEELTRQLEELRRGRSNKNSPPPSALELDKLRRELMYRNKLNEQQNQRLHQQREALTARQEEMSAIDKRISELQERLHRKRILNQQLANQISATSHKAAYHQLVRLTGSQDQTNQVALTRKHQQNNNDRKGLSRGNIAAVEPYNHIPVQQNHQIKNVNTHPDIKLQNTYDLYQPVYYMKKDQVSPKPSCELQDVGNKLTNSYPPKNEDNEILKDFSASKTDPKYQTLPYNTKFTVNLLNNMNKINKDEIINNNEEPKGNANENVIMHTGHMTVHSAPLYMVNRNIATALNQHDLPTKTNSDNNKDIIINSNEELIHKDTREREITPISTNLNSITPTYQKPISSVAPTSVHHTNIISNFYQTNSIKVQPVEPQTISGSSTATTTTNCLNTSNNLIQSSNSLVLSPPQSSSTPLNSTPEAANKTPKPALPPKPAIKPPPRQTQLLNEENGVGVPLPVIPTIDVNEEKNLGKKLDSNTQKQVSTPIHSHTITRAEMIIKAKPLTIKKQPFAEQPKLRTLSSSQNGLNRRTESLPLKTNLAELQIIDKPATEDKDETDKSSMSDEADQEEKGYDNVIRRCKKGNLKQTGKTNLSRRVSFDPLALLLDASLEGELELVKKTATQVTNPSAANDEGITALHNAICAGHLEIVKFLVEFGCDVNAQDSDGWTPLHCAASCNNLTMVKFLVEHGACIFATTLSDHETAAEKCEEDEEGFDGCSEYLYSVQEKLGILSGGVVYAVFDYTAQQPDELSFKEGEQITVLRKGDENEREWWWSSLEDKEGYIPRNLLGLYPRVSKNED
ncbi:cortactin-binding protein 2 isoform X1 [Diorhabda sublineata]|uniref:cortactin-binding protein 2 isoform X1 n=2 Tax=Diorhabda sublineata TaxID=1163346 RepID=UPI0024E0FDD7|nr:cortactin-binding protein 2 isoform X1 [Diorhabda sublineata]